MVLGLRVDAGNLVHLCNGLRVNVEQLHVSSAKAALTCRYAQASQLNAQCLPDLFQLDGNKAFEHGILQRQVADANFGLFHA